MHLKHRLGAAVAAVAVLGGGAVALSAVTAGSSPTPSSATKPEAKAKATTSIQHLVVIFGENVSFDHYFGTYPKAQNPPGQPRFTALPNTPAVNGLSPAL